MQDITLRCAFPNSTTDEFIDTIDVYYRDLRVGQINPSTYRMYEEGERPGWAAYQVHAMDRLLTPRLGTYSSVRDAVIAVCNALGK